MSLFSSLYTGTTGLTAQSKATAIVANNVANLNTTGFKRSDTAFYDLFANSGGVQETPGFGVVATKLARIDSQGGLRQTDSLLDAGITGNGFFPVRTSPYDTDSRMLYTRVGQFDVADTGNGEAFLRNSNGFFLYGWRLDAAGNTMGGGLDSLVPVQLNPGLMEILVPTTAARIDLNLNADQAEIDTHFLTAPYNQLPVSEQATFVPPNVVDNSQAPHYSRSIEMYDSVGQSSPVTFEFRKIAGPGAHATSNAAPLTGGTALVNTAMPGINAGDSFTVSSAGGSQEYIIGAPAGPGQVRVDTVGELIADLNSNLGGGGVIQASLDSNGRLAVYASDLTAQLTFTETSGTPLTGLNSLSLQPDPLGGGLTYSPDPANYPNQGDLPALGANATAQHWWEMRVLGPADANGIQPELTKGLINFTASGQLNVAGEPTLTLRQSALGTNFPGDVTVDMTGFTQYGGLYSVRSADQNGAPVGERDGIAIQEGGIIAATYTNGESIPIYRIPLAMFTNVNGMAEVTGTVFAESPESGEVTLNFVNEGGAGIVNPSTLENSNVDLGNEFAKMIVSQRAFSASSQLITTINEMTEYLTQLSR